MRVLQQEGQEAKLDDVHDFETSNAFTEQEKAAMAYAEAMTFSDRNVTDEMVDRLRPHFDDDAIVELTALIAFQNASSKFNAALDLPAQGLCKMRTPTHL